MKTNIWTLDPTHSEIEFKVKHLMISTVTGSFKSFDASIESNGNDFTGAQVTFNADVNSIFTNNEQRDAHLRNGDFFDSENHPKLSFTSNKLEKTDEENYRISGTLTMRGISRNESFNVEFGGLTTDPWGNTRSGFSISGKIKRTDYGISFGAVADTGGVMLSDEVRINANVQFILKSEAVAA